MMRADPKLGALPKKFIPRNRFLYRPNALRPNRLINKDLTRPLYPILHPHPLRSNDLQSPRSDNELYASVFLSFAHTS